MLEIKNLHTIALDDNSKILKGLNLNIGKGEVHVIMGPNGSGKSTLANTILNSPRYKITSGDILFEGESIINLKTDKISNLGIFMSFQTPIELPGITLRSFLKTIKKPTNMYTFAKEVDANLEKLEIDKSYLDREVNVGFSGGEKKKCEILELLTLNPKLAILDETDSGLDVDAIKIVSNGINLYKNSANAILIITHSIKLLESIKVDYVHILKDGKIIKTGDYNLALEIEKSGYNKYLGESYED